MNKPHILIMALVDVSGNPRPRRFISLTKSLGYAVSVVGFPQRNPVDVDQFYPLTIPSQNLAPRVTRKLIRLGQIAIGHDFLLDQLHESRWGLKSLNDVLSRQCFDIIVVEDIHLLPFAFRIKGKEKIIFDAREYHPREFEGNFLWRLTEQKSRIKMCETYLPQCDAVMTVSEGLRAQYAKEFSISPHLIKSIPYFCDLIPTPVDPHHIRLVHHGIANPDRKIENMIELMEYAHKRYTLDLYLNGNHAYIERLKKMAADKPYIRFRDPIPFDDIIPTLNQYDMGLCFLYPSTFNLKHCLPNKLFEFIQGRLAVLSGPSPDIAEILMQHRCGFVSEDFTPFRTGQILNKLTPAMIEDAKRASHAASKILCFEQESKKVSALLYGLLSEEMSKDS